MNSIEEKIALLTVRIQDLASQQNVFKAKLLELVQELDLLKAQAAHEGSTASQLAETASVKTATTATCYHSGRPSSPLPKPPVQTVSPNTSIETVQTGTRAAPIAGASAAATAKPVINAGTTKNNNLEEFLGKNLASKVGILVTVIGIFIGAKYAIQHDLISEQVRIMLGYLSGLVLAGLGLRLRKKYPAYSAVLLGGGLCVCYFITYIAFTYYHLFPRMVAFGYHGSGHGHYRIWITVI